MKNPANTIAVCRRARSRIDHIKRNSLVLGPTASRRLKLSLERIDARVAAAFTHLYHDQLEDMTHYANLISRRVGPGGPCGPRPDREEGA